MKKISCIVSAVYLSLLVLVPVLTGFCFFKGSTSKLPETGKVGTRREIKYLDTSDGKVKSCDFEEYLVGVLAAEMPAEYELEALKAQAVAARSYIFSKLEDGTYAHQDAAICTDPNHCKGYIAEKTAKSRWGRKKADRYWKKLKTAVEDTTGEYMMCDEQVVEAFFFARSGGRTENSEDVWGGARPYLRSVDSAEDKNYPEYVSTVEFDNQKARSLLGNGIDVSDKILKVGRVTRTEGGNVESIELDDKKFKGTEVRKIFGLKSADFDVLVSEKSIMFSVRGYGHGVGMSQFGANEMAKRGKKYTEILSHYYTNIQIVKK